MTMTMKKACEAYGSLRADDYSCMRGRDREIPGASCNAEENGSRKAQKQMDEMTSRHILVLPSHSLGLECTLPDAARPLMFTAMPSRDGS
jgi:hypothetical protein